MPVEAFPRRREEGEAGDHRRGTITVRREVTRSQRIDDTGAADLGQVHMPPPPGHVPENGSRLDHDLPDTDTWPHVDVLEPPPMRRPYDDLVRLDTDDDARQHRVDGIAGP